MIMWLLTVGAVTIEAESSPGHDHHGLEQAQIEHNSTELSSPSHTGSSYGNWMPAVSCVSLFIIGDNIDIDLGWMK